MKITSERVQWRVRADEAAPYLLDGMSKEEERRGAAKDRCSTEEVKHLRKRRWPIDPQPLKPLVVRIPVLRREAHVVNRGMKRHRSCSGLQRFVSYNTNCRSENGV